MFLFILKSLAITTIRFSYAIKCYQSGLYGSWGFLNILVPPGKNRSALILGMRKMIVNKETILTLKGSKLRLGENNKNVLV